MTYPSVEDLIVREITERMNAVEKQILNGACPSYDRYMWFSGQLVGMKIALTAMQEIIDKWKDK